jgi:hypothetical protein
MKIWHLNSSTITLQNFKKNLPDVFTVGSTSNSSRGSLARLHLRLACIADVPLKKRLGQGGAGSQEALKTEDIFLFWSYFKK